MCKIYENIQELKRELDRLAFDIYVTSGGFDPLHVGHLRCIQDGAEMAQKASEGVLVVIVNGDGFLERKKDYSFMPCDERMEIIAGIEGVDYVVPWDDGSQTVIGALEILEPHFFLKGGDRDNRENVPEFDICKELNCKIVFNVGGGKVQSSSALIERQHIVKNLTLRGNE
jgi:D-beta-D-heptose 7-phosphate kinase/D-beta-D-heptose 1-phosphate adenosyltransferase